MVKLAERYEIWTHGSIAKLAWRENTHNGWKGPVCCWTYLGLTGPQCMRRDKNTCTMLQSRCFTYNVCFWKGLLRLHVYIGILSKSNVLARKTFCNLSGRPVFPFLANDFCPPPHHLQTDPKLLSCQSKFLSGWCRLGLQQFLQSSAKMHCFSQFLHFFSPC